MDDDKLLQGYATMRKIWDAIETHDNESERSVIDSVECAGVYSGTNPVGKDGTGEGVD